MDQRSALDQAITLHRSGSLSEADFQYLSILRHDPKNSGATHMLGMLRYQQGRILEALELLQRALTIAPDSATTWSNYGIVLQADNRFDEALASYSRALTLNPRFAGAFYNRANTLRAVNRLEEAVESYNLALAIEPDNADCLYNRGLTLFELQKFEEAIASYENALKIRPAFPEALNNRGNALRKLKRPMEALASYEQAISIRPNHFEAYQNCSAAYQELNQFENALASIDKALEIGPATAELFSSRGNTLVGLNRLDEALESFGTALGQNPRRADTLNYRGVALLRLKLYVRAIESFDEAIEIDCNYDEALGYRGRALHELKRYEEALRSFDRAIELQPNRAVYWNDRAVTLRDLGKIDQSIRDLDRAIELDPSYADALFNRGTIQWAEKKNYDSAIRDLENTLVINPDHAFARGDLLHLRMHAGDWREYALEKNAIEEGVKLRKQVIRPFMYQAISDSPVSLKACAEVYADYFFPSARAQFSANRQRHAKIRVGYVSGEFREQATAYLAVGLYEHHDKTRFEIIAFDNGVSDGGPTRRRLEAAFDKFVPIAALSDRAATQRVLQEEVDILVDLNGYFGASRTAIFASKPAPIQVNYLGFPGTLGASYFDYILADRLVIPESDHQFYSEKVVYLPDCYQVNDQRTRRSSAKQNRAEHNLPQHGFVFCSFNQSYKLTPLVFASWMRILRDIDDSVLWLLDSHSHWAVTLRKAAYAHGVAPERLIFAPMVPPDDHLGRIELADLFLDSMPCNAHTTASDALWAGVPMITCRGTSFPGRVATSLLYTIGLPELVTSNIEEYEALAIKLAREPNTLESIRKKLISNRWTSPLFDVSRYRENIESAYVQMVETWRSGQPPKSFSVSKQN
jgi:protein O-GlcNAc transferase